MVLVTHDVNLKNFAHRVVRMRDGKVAQIEEISQRLREQAKEQLWAQLGVRGLVGCFVLCTRMSLFILTDL